MKHPIKKFAIVFLLLIAAFINPKQGSAQQNNVSFQVFYDALSPYGQWVDYKNYGYAWIPDVGTDFVPYSTSGYWTLTDYGWTWVSDYDWGWAPFHYGRWDYDNYYGWLWVPDNEWGPSWVNWRQADGYYGWSPMEPGISISIAFGRPYNSYNDHWIFVRDRDFERHDLYRYSVDQSDHAMIIRNSTVINRTYIDNSRHTTYVTGPSRDDVQRVTGRRINPVSIQENTRPGKDINEGNLRMYRPQVVKNGGSDRKPAPTKIETIDNVKRPSQRNGQTQQREMNQQNNNTKPIPQQQGNPAGNSPRQQQQNANPQKNNAQPQQQINPAGNSQRQQQQNANPQKNNAQPQQQKNPAGNSQRQQQQNANPQKNNAQPQQQINPAGNSQRQQQQNATPQRNNAQPQQQINPAGNSQRQQQQNATPQRNNAQPQPARQQQRAAPANSNQKQQNTEKQQNQKKDEQQK